MKFKKDQLTCKIWKRINSHATPLHAQPSYWKRINWHATPLNWHACPLNWHATPLHAQPSYWKRINWHATYLTRKTINSHATPLNWHATSLTWKKINWHATPLNDFVLHRTSTKVQRHRCLHYFKGMRSKICALLLSDGNINHQNMWLQETMRMPGSKSTPKGSALNLSTPYNSSMASVPCGLIHLPCIVMKKHEKTRKSQEIYGKTWKNLRK